MGTGRNRYLTWVASAVAVGLLGSALAAPVAVAAPEDPYLNTALPAITGVAKVGVTLTASPGSWTPAPETFSYQWMRDGADVSGAVTASYALAAADLNHAISVEVTASGKEQTPGSATSAKTAKVVAGTLKAARPSVSGELAVGSTIKAAASGWTTGTTFTRQWYADGKAIAKATGESFRLGSGQAGKRISVKLTGSKAGYSSVSVASAQTVKVMKASTPKISGSAKNGSKLKVKTGSWTSKVKKSYQWLRNGAAIRKATKSTYKLTASDVGKKISVRVTGKRSGYATISRTSGAVSVRGYSLKVGSPKVSGTAVVGGTVSVSPGSWTKGTTIKYQWYADGVKVAKGTGKSLRPGYLEAGRKLKVTVTGSKAGYNTASKTVTLPKAIPSDAVYRVGVDIPAGKLIGGGPAYNKCGWWRLQHLQGNPIGADIGEEGVLGYRSLLRGQALAELSASDPYFLSVGCGKWSKLPTKPSLKTSIGDGDYAVGIHLQPGTWRSTGATASCYVEWAYGAAGTDLEIYDVYDASEVTELDIWFDSSFARISVEGCGTWTRIGDVPAATARTTSRVAPAGANGGSLGAERLESRLASALPSR